VFFSAAKAASQIERIQSGKQERPRLTVARDAAELADRAAARFVELADSAIRDQGRFLVALAGGSTPETLYRRLATSPYKETVEWEKIEWFWGDERWVSHDDPQSNCGMARRALLDHLPVSPQRIHPIPTHLASATEAAEEYESTIRNVAGGAGGGTPVLDLVLLGIGTDGHTASWFPDVPLDVSVQSLAWGGYVPAVEAPRVTITPRVIGAARCALFLASGSAKADIVARTLYPPWQGRHPAARVALSDGDIEWFVDSEAAEGIRLSDFF
jgi:6-phosphogluconolactonase